MKKKALFVLLLGVIFGMSIINVKAVSPQKLVFDGSKDVYRVGDKFPSKIPTILVGDEITLHAYLIRYTDTVTCTDTTTDPVCNDQTGECTTTTTPVCNDSEMGEAIVDEVLTSDKVEFFSANSEIATITKDGKLKAIKKGKVKITAKADDSITTLDDNTKVYELELEIEEVPEEVVEVPNTAAFTSYGLYLIGAIVIAFGAFLFGFARKSRRLIKED